MDSKVIQLYIYMYLGEGNGNPLQSSCLENSMDREAWRATVHGVMKSQTRLSDFRFTYVYLGFPDSSVGKESPAMQETPVQFLSQEDPLEKQ